MTSSLKGKVTGFIEKFELTYWVLHLYRKHEAVQCLIQINNQLSNKISSQPSNTKSVDSVAELAKSEIFDNKEPTPKVTFSEQPLIRPTKSFSPLVPLKEESFT